MSLACLCSAARMISLTSLTTGAEIPTEGFKIDDLGTALLSLANKGEAEFGAHILQHLLAVVASL